MASTPPSDALACTAGEEGAGAMKLLTIFGTRPEAIKLAPVLAALRHEPEIHSFVCVTGQHREMLNPVLDLFGIIPDYDLELMEQGQSLNTLLSRAIQRIEEVLCKLRPDRVLVQGDTTSALAGAWAAFHQGIPVAHVEAGLRTYANQHPFPEEANRRTIDLVSDLLFAPTPAARSNLRGEKVEGRIVVTGNTGVDALKSAAARLAREDGLRAAADAALPTFDPGRKLLLVTCHRRESFGASFSSICEALLRLARRDDLQIAYPLHLNPNVAHAAREALGGRANLHLLPPLAFLPFVRLMERADVILTDSGGVQEEAPSLGKAVLVMREVSERQEAIEARSARLVGTDAEAIEREVAAMIEAAGETHIPMAANPYGDGLASSRIVDSLLGRPLQEFAAVADQPALVVRIA
jgi:UDP-N-acetylglucosamine 2-epimerase (non-hydrolysing)